MLDFKKLAGKMMEYKAIFHHLHKAINDEYNSFLQYASAQGGCNNENIKKEFNEHALEEYKHSLMFYEILTDLGGQYPFHPNALSFKTDCGFRTSCNEMSKIVDNIKSENCAIVSYNNLLSIFDWNEKHEKMIKSIIADEQEHVNDLIKLLKEVKKSIN